MQEEFRTLNQVCPVTSIGQYDAIQYYSLNMPGSNIRVATVVLGEMGINIASQVTEKVIARLAPKVIVLIGIAGALDQDVKLGDVVVASEINEFLATSKAVQQGKSFIFEFSGNHWKTDFALAQIVGNLEFSAPNLYRTWRDMAKDFRSSLGLKPSQLKLAHDIPELKIGHIASGDTVGAAQAYTIMLQGVDRKFLALEMEAAGFAQSAHGRETPVKTMVIRGISDFADERKKKLDSTAGGAWRKYAMYSASTFLINLFQAQNVQDLIAPAAPALDPQMSKVTSGMAATISILVQLREVLSTKFNEGELQTLCFDFGIDYENLPGKTKADKARELVKYFEDRSRTGELLAVVKKERSNISFDTTVPDAAGQSAQDKRQTVIISGVKNSSIKIAGRDNQ